MTKKPKRSPFRWLRFSIRSVLMFTFVAAIVCAWWLQPEKREIPLVGGAMVLQESYKVAGDDNSVTINHGSWILKDRDEVTRVDGRYWNGQPHGTWTIYHANGQRATQGKTHTGRPTGRWRSWYPDGTLQTEFHYGDRRLTKTRSLHDHQGMGTWGVGFGPPLVSADEVTEYASPREGPFRAWWPNGQLKTEGQYADDRRDGQWMFYDEDGDVTASGTYSKGRRHGLWKTRQKDGSTFDESFAGGRPVGDLDRAIESAIERLSSGEQHQRLAAARQLRLLDSLAVGALIQQFSSFEHDAKVLTLRTLADIGPAASQALPLLDQFTNTKNRQLRIHLLLARHAIDSSNQTAHYQTLVDFLNTGDGRLYVFAMCSAFDRDSENRHDITRRLMAAAACGHDGIREEIISELAIRGNEIMSQMRESIQDDDIAIRVVTIDVLEQTALRRSYNNASGNAVAEILDIARNDTNEIVQRRMADVSPWLTNKPSAMGTGSGFF